MDERAVLGLVFVSLLLVPPVAQPGSTQPAGNPDVALKNIATFGLLDSNSLDCRRIWTSVGDGQISSEYGSVVAAARDVNRDGYDDILVGSPLYSTAKNASAGKAYLYFGGPSGPSKTPAWTSVGDDSFVAYFGASIAADDLNLDGYADVIIGAPGYLQWSERGRGHAGKIYVFHGSPTGLGAEPAQTILGDRNFENYFGLNLAVVGDVDGNGYPDLVVSHGRYVGVSRIYLYLNGPSGFSAKPAWQFPAEGAFDSILGESIGGADVDGDGNRDLVVADPFYYSNSNSSSFEGKVYVFSGGPKGWASTPSRSWVGTRYRGLFGRYTASGGDVNGDGYDDIAIGALGAVELHQGTARGATANATWATNGNWTDFLGQGLALDGDLTGDGLDDLLLGAMGHDEPQFVDTGELRIYSGRRSGLLSSPDVVVSGDPEPYAHFGWAVAFAGKVDGILGDEFIVGHRSFWVGAQTPGKAYVFTCGPRSEARVSLQVDPKTLNLKSNGNWITARIEVDRASPADIESTSLTLNGVPAAWVHLVHNETLMAKFDRAAFAATVSIGEILVILEGRWKDGGAFRATDTIRVIRPGR